MQMENMDEINWSNGFFSDMLSLDFDNLFSNDDLKSFSHFVIMTQLIGNRTSFRTVQG